MTIKRTREDSREEGLEIARLRQENELLANQVKRLIKTETRLYEYQQELDSQLKEYQKLYELNRKFNSDYDIQRVFEYALEYIIQELEYERAIFLQQQDDSDVYTVCAVDGYYDCETKHAVTEVIIKQDDPFLTPLLREGHERIICQKDSQEQKLSGFRDRFFMNEYLVYRLGSSASKPALLVVGNSSQKANLYRRINNNEGALLGIGNLVGILSSSVKNHSSYIGMEKALNQERITETKYRSIFENAIEGFFQTTPEGRIIGANPSTAAILGYKNQDELKAAVSNVSKELYVDPSRREELLRQLSTQDAVSDFEAQFRRKDGKTIWTSHNVRAVRDDKGKLVCLEAFMADISKRKEAEKNLEETKQFLGKIINSIPDPVFVKDQQHRWVLINDAFCCFMNRRHEDLIGKSDYDFFPKNKADIFWKKDEFVLDSGKEDINEIELADAEGITHTIVTKKTLYTDERGEKFIVGINRDVTDLKQTNEALRKSQEMLTNVLANFPGVVFWKDHNSVYIGCNRNFSHGAGLADPSMIVGKTDYDLPWALTEADAYRSDDSQVMESGIAKLNIIETQLQSDGNIVWFDTSKVPLYDPAGVVIGVLGIANDITKRKKDEVRLHKDRKRADMLLELYEKSGILTEKQLYSYALNQAVSLTDSTTGFFHLVSDDQKNVFLTSWTEEALTNCTADYNTHYSIEEAGNWVDCIRLKQAVVYNDFEASPNCKGLPADHTPLRRFVSIPVMEGDKVRFIIGVGNKVENYDQHDIMHIQLIANELQHIINQRHAEDMLREAQEELVRKDKLAILGQLSGSVGHELRNPLGVMNNAIYFLKMVLTDADETTREYLDIIKQEIDNSLRIITDLLDFARTRAPQTRTVTVRELIDESLGKCLIPENISIQEDLAETMPLLRIDPQQIEQVLQNLITNGIQAMPDGGSLCISAQRIHGDKEKDRQQGTLGLDPDSDFVKICVTDIGKGIAPENMKRLFQPLFTTKARGIGLGLVVCKNLIEANCGRIEVKSEVGKGTVFSLLLPAESKTTSQ